jgi:hypothetical protein
LFLNVIYKRFGEPVEKGGIFKFYKGNGRLIASDTVAESLHTAQPTEFPLRIHDQSELYEVS